MQNPPSLDRLSGLTSFDFERPYNSDVSDCNRFSTEFLKDLCLSVQTGGVRRMGAGAAPWDSMRSTLGGLRGRVSWAV